MPTQPTSVRGPRPQKILWKWTAVSAVLHVFAVGLLCAVSYYTFQKKQVALAEKARVEEAAAQKLEADRLAKRAADAPAPTPTPVATITPPPEAPRQAEAILGIDKTAKPNETPSSPFAGGDDDLLKDLK